MLYDSGILYICTLENTAEPGMMPTEQLVRRKKYWYGERTVGYSRRYAALGANQRIDLLVRIPQDRTIRAGEFAVLGNGEQYRIDSVTSGAEDTELRWTDLTLVRLEDLYDIYDPEQN